MKRETGLNFRRQRFLTTYLTNGGIVAGAAREAGPAIAAAIQEAVEAQAMAAAEVLTRLAEQARASIEQFSDLDVEVEVVGDDGTARTERRPWGVNLERVREAGLLHVIKKLSYDKRGYSTLELYNAQAAQALLSRILRLFTGARGAQRDCAGAYSP